MREGAARAPPPLASKNGLAPPPLANPAGNSAKEDFCPPPRPLPPLLENFAKNREKSLQYPQA